MELESQIGGQCILCGEPAGFGGLFVPDDPWAYGAPAGKIRALAYPICKPCITQGDRAKSAVENLLMLELGRAYAV